MKMFRITRGGFEELLALISPFMHDTDEYAIYSSGSSISKRTKLYVTLRWLAGGSYLDICFAWGIAESTFYSTDHEREILWPTIEAIDEAFVIGLPFHDVDANRLYGSASAAWEEFDTSSSARVFSAKAAVQSAAAPGSILR
mmetsp:Transcript_27898/g.38425  ORF Transcript_27898/g.38425 Transcript_27898/m.38425 type:complete len:142 (-) Transcript_27898:279-704(-)